MNQQRSRRFRASKETGEKIEMMASIKADLTLRGCQVPAEKAKGEHFDSNCITPVRRENAHNPNKSQQSQKKRHLNSINNIYP